MIIGIEMGRPKLKLTLDAVIKNDSLNLGEHLVLNRVRWCKMIHATDLNWLRQKLDFVLFVLIYL